MRRMNILNKQGMLTDEDRKKPFVHHGHHLRFETCLDLSQGVKVKPLGSAFRISAENYSNDLMGFIAYWKDFVFEDLNGFSGFSHIKFEFSGFEIVHT